MLTDEMLRAKCYGQNVTRTKCYRTKGYGHNVMDKMLWTKCYGQIVMDKMLWIKCYGQNVNC